MWIQRGSSKWSCWKGQGARPQGECVGGRLHVQRAGIYPSRYTYLKGSDLVFLALLILKPTKTDGKWFYSEVTLDQSLTFKTHRKKTAAEVRTGTKIVLKPTTWSSWKANAQLLNTTQPCPRFTSLMNMLLLPGWLLHENKRMTYDSMILHENNYWHLFCDLQHPEVKWQHLEILI